MAEAPARPPRPAAGHSAQAGAATEPMAWLKHLDAQLAVRRSQHLERELKVAEGPCAPRVKVTAPGGGTREMLGFCSNDYLGLAHHPALAQALAEGARLWGAGSGASHLISGHSRAHAQLEAQLAATQAAHIPGAQALFMSTGYMANMALIGGLAEAGCGIFSDKLNHASLIDGAMLAKAWARCEVVRYPHSDLKTLDSKLAAFASTAPTAPRFIVTDAVFSMDGDIAPLPELLALARTHDAALIIDDAHGFGVLGPHGHGALAHFKLKSERLIYMGTLGKAAGISGAFIAAHPSVIRWLVNNARAYIYTTATPPAIAHALSASLTLIAGPEGDARRRHLHALIEQLRAGLAPLAANQGWTLLPSESAIQPVVVGDNGVALTLSRALDEQGLWVPAIRPPTVPPGSARLRITLSAAHTGADVNQLIGGLHVAAGKLRRAAP